MEVTLFDLVVGVIAIVSLVFNFFQLYKDKINRQKLSDERRLHETILTGLWQNMNEGAKSLEQLKRKGANGSTVADNIARIINAQRIEVGEFLKRYYNVEVSREASPLELASVSMDTTKSQATSTELIEGVEAMTSAMIETVEQADRYIFCVGGRSRNNAYLDVLRQRVLRGDVRHIRVITGDHIRHQLCEHIRNIFQHVELGYLKEDQYGGILVTHNTVILALYSSNVPSLDKGLKIESEQTASDYRPYVQDLLAASEKNLSMDFIHSLCTICRSKTNIPPDTHKDKGSRNADSS
jgi:hypothetical protein